MEPEPLHGTYTHTTCKYSRIFIVLLQIEISHKNQVPMLLAPPPKSRSLFSFLNIARRKSDDFLDDPE